MSQPFERIPLWHRQGALIVTAAHSLRVDTQDWSQLIVQAFPASHTAAVVQRTVYPQNDETASGKNTLITMETAIDAPVTITMVPEHQAPVRAWVLRVQLERGESVQQLEVDGVSALHLFQARYVLLSFLILLLRFNAATALVSPV